MIPTEDNYIDWVLNGIREYFRRINFRVLTYSIGQIKERQCPVDRVLKVGNKIVGLQFKRPETADAPFKYKTTIHQHQDISKARWIFYCLPDFVDSNLQEVALYHCKFTPAENSSTINDIVRYYRWGPFSSAILECREGLKIAENDNFGRIITYMSDNPRKAFIAPE